jgi:hypothetical protein
MSTLTEDECPRGKKCERCGKDFAGEEWMLYCSSCVCRWSPIEEGSSTYQPGCCNEWWNLEDNCELYPFCHWCGKKIEETEAEHD